MNGILKIIKKNKLIKFSSFNKNFSTHFRKEFKCFSNTQYLQTRVITYPKNNFVKFNKNNFSQKDENENDKKEKEKLIHKQELTKQLIHLNIWLLLSLGVTVLYFLKNNSEKEVSFEDFANYVLDKKISEIEIKKGIDLFYYVFAQLNDNSKVKIKILDNESFIKTLEKIQLEMVKYIKFILREIHLKNLSLLDLAILL